MIYSIVLLILLLASSNSSCASADDEPDTSPDGRYSIYNFGRSTWDWGSYYEIRSKDGTVLLSTKSDTNSPSHANEAMWSSDNQFVLFWYNHGQPKATGIYSFTEHKLLSLYPDLDGYTVPVRWIGPHTFVVENLTGMLGHDNGPVVHYRQTFRVHIHPFSIECIYTGPTIIDPKADDP